MRDCRKIIAFVFLKPIAKGGYFFGRQ